jgi:SAM-dependent methyltransferase
MTEDRTEQDVRTHVRDRYAQIATNFQPDLVASCCGPAESDCCSTDAGGFVQFYETTDVAELPDEVTGLSLGCGDPITLAALEPGQTVLDLGSGGGIDCFLAAQKVGPKGLVIGVDMTPAMLDKARANKEKMGLENVEFRLGEIENLPVADETVDVIISNCVINLSPDKRQVFREAFRVLSPGGKLAVSDIVTDGPLPEVIKSSLSAWAGCVAGALDIKDYIAAIKAAGFVDVNLTPVYMDREVVDQAVKDLGEVIDLSDVPQKTIHKTIFSAKITAYKPRSDR